MARPACGAGSLRTPHSALRISTILHSDFCTAPLYHPSPNSPIAPGQAPTILKNSFHPKKPLKTNHLRLKSPKLPQISKKFMVAPASRGFNPASRRIARAQTHELARTHHLTEPSS